MKPPRTLNVFNYSEITLAVGLEPWAHLYPLAPSTRLTIKFAVSEASEDLDINVVHDGDGLTIELFCNDVSVSGPGVDDHFSSSETWTSKNPHAEI